MIKQRTYLKHTREAIVLLGEQIKLKRKQQGWTEKNLAERANISRVTLQKIERGELTCAIGLVFEAAALVGVPLFDDDTFLLSDRIRYTREMTTLLKKPIKTNIKEIDDDF